MPLTCVIDARWVANLGRSSSLVVDLWGPACIPTTVLRTDLVEDRATLAAERLAAGPAYEDSGYVFSDELGAPIHPAAVSFQFEQAVKRTTAPPIRLHDLRHTSATLDLAAGTHPKVVQEKLGHANIAMTLDLNSHVMPGMQEDAAVVRGNLLYGSA